LFFEPLPGNAILSQNFMPKLPEMTKLKIAVQKSGRLSEKSIQLLRECGISLSNGDRKLRMDAGNFPIEVLFLRDDDIPQYVEQGVADVGILGENEVWEKDKQVVLVEKLGFAACRLSLAIPKDEIYTGPAYFQGKRVATSYPRILRKYFEEQQVDAAIEEIGGSVEIAPGIGLAEGIFDIVSTGSTLLMNGLKEVEVVVRSEAVLIGRPDLDAAKRDILDKILFRIKAVRNSAQNKYILLNAPNDAIPEISRILPGMKSPTVLPLVEPGWSSIHSVVREDEFWDVIDELKRLGAQGILVIPIEKMVL
jgi:ATP phosphoribosyltransferase